jgi:hypothetical protein
MNLSSRPGVQFPTEDELLAKVLDRITAANLIVGETLPGPVATVLGGKLYDPVSVNPTFNSIGSSHLANVRPVEKGEQVQVTTLKFQFDAVDQIDFSKVPRGTKYIYPFSIQIPHADVLPKLVIGDDIVVMDAATFLPVVGTVTQSTIDAHSFGLFRFAVGSL